MDGRILTDFLGLRARNPASIQVFASRVGTLHTYSEDFVSQSRLKHTSLWEKHYRALPGAIRDEDKENGVDTFEPIAYWQDFSRFAFLTLQLATQLEDIPGSDTTPILEADWQFFSHFLDESRRPRFEKFSKRHEPGRTQSGPHDDGDRARPAQYVLRGAEQAAGHRGREA